MKHYTRPRELSSIPKHKRLEILRKFADKISQLEAVSIISVVVDKQTKSPGYDVFDKAWQALIQRFENTIGHRNFPGPANAQDTGIISCDKTDEKKLT